MTTDVTTDVTEVTMSPRCPLPRTLRALALTVPCLLVGASYATPEEAKGDAPSAPPPASPLPWMVSFPATDELTVGMDPSDVQAFLDKQLKSEWKKDKGFPTIWENVLLLMTPAHKRTDVPAFSLSKFEVTNAQWEVFLRSRMESGTTQGGETLESLAAALWNIDPNAGSVLQRAWMNLFRANEAKLLAVLNPGNDPKWDPLMARAGSAKLPKGIELRYTRFPIPPHWGADGQVPAEQRRRPARYLSLEQCIDFCEWAGFHLPAEVEWERAARGVEGRWFPWGNEFDPKNALWRGFNEAAKHAAESARAKGESVKVQPLANADGSVPDEVDGPVEVDTFPQGATPEGILHMTGNVSEYVMDRSSVYPGSKTRFKYAGETAMTRGGNYEDRAEVLLAADRNTESHQGALLPSHSVDSYGLRLAAYPVAGADLGASAVRVWQNRQDPSGPWLWIPLPPGAKDRKSADPYLGFALQNTAGVLERSLDNASADHAFVTGPARGVAFVPVKGFPSEFVAGAADIAKYATDADRPVFLGVLVGTENLRFSLAGPATTEPPAEGAATLLPLRNERFFVPVSGHLYTRADLGHMLVLEQGKVMVYAPDSSVAGVKKYRNAPLGALAAPASVEIQRGPSPSSGRMDGSNAVLSATIPLLDKKGQPLKGATAPSIRVTITIPVAH